MQPPGKNFRRTVDEDEIRRFDLLANDWWDPDGPSAMLFRLNPVRISFILDNLAEAISTRRGEPNALAGLQMLDVGCGGGILSEPMARLGEWFHYIYLRVFTQSWACIADKDEAVLATDLIFR